MNFIQETVVYINSQYLKAINEKDRFTLVLSGGNTPKFIFEALLKNYSKKIDWKQVHVFWLDERCVAIEHIDSNYKLAKDYLLDFVEVGSIHRMQGELNPKDAAEFYEKDIKNFFDLKEDEIPSFDCILLGMGEDGHCASLFPDSKELREQKKLVVATEKVYNGHHRISLTLLVINNSHSVLMINSQKKLEVFNDKEKELPIHKIDIGTMQVIMSEDLK